MLTKDIYNYFIRSFLEFLKFEEKVFDTNQELKEDIPENISKILDYLLLHITYYYKYYKNTINKQIIDLKLESTNFELYERIKIFIDLIESDPGINEHYNQMKNNYNQISKSNKTDSQDKKNIITRNKNTYINLIKSYNIYYDIINNPKNKKFMDLNQIFNDMYVLYNAQIENNILFMIFNLNIDTNIPQMIQDMINIEELKNKINNDDRFKYDFAKASEDIEFIKIYEKEQYELGNKLYGGKKFTKTSNKVYIAKRERLIYLGQRNRKYIKMKGIMIPLSEAKKLK